MKKNMEIILETERNKETKKKLEDFYKEIYMYNCFANKKMSTI